MYELIEDKCKVVICSRVDQQWNTLFLHAVKHGLNALIVADDKAQVSEIRDFFQARLSNTFWSTASNQKSIFHVDTISNIKTFSGYFSIGIASLYQEDAFLAVESARKERLPVLHTTLDTNYINDEERHWHTIQDEYEQPTYPEASQLIENAAIRKLFIDTFSIAQSEINIICPWINQTVINLHLVKLIDKALTRGVNIKIIYGIGDGTDTRSITSEETVGFLKKKFQKFEEQLSFKRENTHVKLLICDDKYIMLGSYNFLSYAGDYLGNDVRGEAVEYNVDSVLIAQRRQRYFSW